MLKDHFDVAVLGGGAGGLVCAAGAAGLGAKTALIEKRKLGGDCLNTGCVPSKTLIRSARIAHLFSRGEEFGLKHIRFEIDFAAVMRRIKRVQAALSVHDSPERFQSLGVTVRFGNFAFLNPHQISDGRETVSAKRFVIATGSSPFVPPIPGCEERHCLTTENIWDIRTLPTRFAVIGAGPIGSELAQAFARLGSKVSLIDMATGALPREDRNMAAIVEDTLKREGITCHFGCAVKRIDHKESMHMITLEKEGSEEKIECDAIFIAVGRIANTKGLGLEQANIKTEKGRIVINQKCETSTPHIYACGDVAGPYQFTHFADYQARVVIRNALFPGKTKADYSVVPWCTYTDPELARVGLSETEAKEKGIPYDLYEVDLKDLDRANCDGEARGKLKILSNKGKDKIIGASMVGSHAGDSLQEVVFAMKQGLGLKAIYETIHSYPTFAEVVRKGAQSWMTGRLQPWIKNLLQWYFKYLFR